jgi:uncharacterized membrane protein
VPPIYAPPGVPPTAGGPAGSWSPTEALGFGWNAIMSDFQGIALPIAVLLLVVAVGSGLPSGGLSVVLTRVAAEIVEPAFLPMIEVMIRLVGQGIGLLVSSYFMGGVAEFALNVARGRTPAFNDVFSGGKYFGPMFVANLLSQIGIGIGFVLCIAPGLILAAGLSMYQSLVVDQKLSGVDALKKSWELTTGHKGQLVIYVLLSIVVGVAGALACCVGALLVSGPMITIASAFIYLKLTGEQPRLPSKVGR